MRAPYGAALALAGIALDEFAILDGRMVGAGVPGGFLGLTARAALNVAYAHHVARLDSQVGIVVMAGGEDVQQFPTRADFDASLDEMAAPAAETTAMDRHQAAMARGAEVVIV